MRSSKSHKCWFCGETIYLRKTAPRFLSVLSAEKFIRTFYGVGGYPHNYVYAFYYSKGLVKVGVSNSPIKRLKYLGYHEHDSFGDFKNAIILPESIRPYELEGCLKSALGPYHTDVNVWQGHTEIFKAPLKHIYKTMVSVYAAHCKELEIERLRYQGMMSSGSTLSQG